MTPPLHALFFFIPARKLALYLHFILAAGSGISLENRALLLLALVPFSPQLEMPCDNQPDSLLTFVASYRVDK